MQRHDLFHLSANGWAGVLGRAWDAEALACLGHWRNHDLPLVVSRQGRATDDAMVALGLPAPACWSRRRLALQVRAGQLGRPAVLPGVECVAGVLPAGLVETLPKNVRIAGSFAWQRMTGLAYVHANSDIDLLVPVADAPAADAVAALLGDCSCAGPRLDGELIFPSGAAVAWREWAAVRGAMARQVLVKRLASAALEDSAALA